MFHNVRSVAAALCKDRRSVAVWIGVLVLDRFIERFSLHDRDHRYEYLLTGDVHIRGYVIDHGRADVCSAFFSVNRRSAAVDQDLSTGGFSFGYIAFDAFFCGL